VSEWEEFRVGALSTQRNWVNPDCQPLGVVYHVCHLQTGLRILEDGRIAADVVKDKSRLNTERVLVTWLSPNTWVRGYRYGNLRFAFDWENLIQGKRYYWVESMAYGIKAPRILVTEREHAGLEPYDPTARDGPWWHDTSSDSHHWNGNYTLEIMLESDLEPSEWEKADFVDHYADGCNIDWRTCPWRGKRARYFAPRFVAAVVARRLSASSLRLAKLDDEGLVSDSCPLFDACSDLWTALGKATSPGGELSGEDPSAQAVARAVLAAFAGEDAEELKSLCRLYRSEEDLLDSCAQLIGKHFKVSGWQDLRRDPWA